MADTSSQLQSNLVFLFSSTMENPDRFFQGYLFHGTDYVFGERGFADFCAAKGISQLDREDGCYVQVEKLRDGSYRFSTDYSGYKKLFYFRDGGFWVVSNSLYRIAAHLRANGYRVLPDVSQLAAMATEGTFYPSGRGSFFSQLTSFDTIVRGVRLVPADCALRIGSSGVRLERNPHRFRDDDYREQLGRFIGTWIGRLETLAREPAVRIACDLTGGVDSRAVLALVLGARIRGGDGLQIRSGSGRETRRDHAVATRICTRFDLPLNGRLGVPQRWLNGKGAYALWKDLCLGVYHPIYFPGAYPAGDVVSLGGGGGENHRPFYARFPSAPSADTLVSRRTRNIAMRSAREDFAGSLQDAIDTIMEDPPAYPDVLTCHYRHFRNRFHAGREPQYTVKFQPLASKWLDSVTAAAGGSRFRNAQVHYDLLHNLNPELLEIPFDSWLKRPGRRVRRQLSPAVACHVPAGTCFVEGIRTARGRRKRTRESDTAIDLLLGEFRQARTGFAREFLGNAYLRAADRAVQTAAHEGRLPPTTQSKRIAVVMACTLFER